VSVAVVFVNRFQIVKKGRRILLVSASLAVACILTMVLWPAEKEPVYEGKKLSAWVQQLNNPLGEWGTATETIEAGNAIRSLGTNALPLLLRWVAYDPAPAKRATYRLLKDWRFDSPSRSLQRQETRSGNAVAAFRCLGSNAISVLPQLNQIMTNSSSRESSFRARDSLAFMHEPALPYLLTAFTNRQFRYRYDLPGLFSFMPALGTDVKPAIPVLIASLKDPDTYTTEVSARALGSLGRQDVESETILPALIEATRDPRQPVRVQAVIALSDMRKPSLAIAQTLINKMDDPAAEVVSYAIRLSPGFESESDLLIPAIVKRLKPSDSIRIRTQLDALAHFGRAARPAIPAILKIMDNPSSPSVWIAASNALYRIDPQALQVRKQSL
jgi:HEAT repeat protein